MKSISDNSIDLTVTSPPYDNLRTYNGNITQWNFEKFQAVARELFRITKQGGVVIWVVGDSTVKGSETGTSFKQALYFKECGFNLYDTMIYRKQNYMPIKQKRYGQEFEYIFVLSKGLPKTFNPIIIPCKYAGVETWGDSAFYNSDSNYAIGRGKRIIGDFKPHGNIFNYLTKNLKETKGHPAPFPEQLAEDNIITWSNENDIVFDPFMGSGTTIKMAILNNRQYIGFDIEEQYCEITKKRLDSIINGSIK